MGVLKKNMNIRLYTLIGPLQQICLYSNKL